MGQIIFKYNLKKIIGIIIICVFFLLFFGYGLINATELSLKEPSGFSRYSWVEKLAYQKPKLIFTTSFIFFILFFSFFIDLFLKLIRKTFLISRIQNKIYLNNKYFIDVDNIQKTNIINRNSNSSVYLYLTDVSKFLKSRTSKIERLKYKFLFLFNKKSVLINLSFFIGNPADNYKIIQKLIKK